MKKQELKYIDVEEKTINLLCLLISKILHLHLKVV